MTEMILQEYEDGFYAVTPGTAPDDINPTAPEGAVFLDDDEDYAQRERALRIFLDDWTSPIEVGSGHYLRVNERYVKSGMSFDEAAKNVELLRLALDETKWVTFGPSGGEITLPVSGIVTLNDLMAVGDAYGTWKREDAYDCISRAIKDRAPGMLNLGLHTVLNTLYHLTKGYDEKQWHCRLLRAVWEGKVIEDTRSSFVKTDGEYLVLTDSEADEAWNEDLNNYIDECLEIPEQVRPYFDEEKWKSDARLDGRGHSLSGYDGCENQVDLDAHDMTFFVYRTS